MSAQGHHTTLWRLNQDPTPVYEEVAGIRDMGEEQRTRETNDATTYALETDSKTSEAGLIDNGTQEIVVVYEKGDSVQELMRADFLSGEERTYQYRYNDAEKTAVTKKVIVSGLGRTKTKGEKVMQKVTLTINSSTDETWT